MKPKKQQGWFDLTTLDSLLYLLIAGIIAVAGALGVFVYFVCLMIWRAVA